MRTLYGIVLGIVVLLASIAPSASAVAQDEDDEDRSNTQFCRDTQTGRTYSKFCVGEVSDNCYGTYQESGTIDEDGNREPHSEQTQCLYIGAP